MADNENGVRYPSEYIPTIFADGVINFNRNQEVVRFYLSRLDPPLDAEGRPDLRSIAQVVMPVSRFLETAAFFENVLSRLVADGVVKEDDVQKVRSIFAQSSE
jgi:hypothetical protein